MYNPFLVTPEYLAEGFKKYAEHIMSPAYDSTAFETSMTDFERAQKAAEYENSAFDLTNNPCSEAAMQELKNSRKNLGEIARGEKPVWGLAEHLDLKAIGIQTSKTAEMCGIAG